MIHLMAWGTGDPNTREFTLSEPHGDDGLSRRIGSFTINLSDIPQLIEELSEWAEQG